MGRKFTLMILFLMALGVMQAQNNTDRNISDEKATVFSESFDTWPPADWTFHLTEGNGFVEGTANYMGGAAMHEDENANCDSWMISPAVTLIEGCNLVFFQKNKYVPSYYEHHGVYVSAGSADPADGDFVLLQEFADTQAEWAEVEASLADYNGQEIFIGFHYTGDFMSEWYIDEMSIVQPEPHDVMVNLDQMAGVQFVGNMVPSVSVENLGYMEMADISVKMSIDGDEVETKTITLAGDASEELAFTEIAVTGDFAIKFEAVYAGETSLDNNVVEKELMVLTKANAFAYAIYYDNEDLPFGPVTFETSNSTVMEPMATASADDIIPFAGTMINNMWFVNMHLNIADEENTKQSIKDTKAQEARNLSLIDITTGESYAMYPSDMIFSSMSYDAIADKVYAINYADNASSLYEIDYRTGEMTQLAAPSTTVPHVAGLAIDGEGTAYAICWDKKLYTVDLATFTFTEVGDLGVSEIGYIQSAAFDIENDALYWSICNSSDGALYYVDKETGEASFISQNLENAELTSLGFVHGDAKYYAALEVKNPDGVALADIDVTIDGKTLTTDAYGMATFCDLTEGQTYAYSATNDEVVVEGTFNMDASKKVEIVFNEDGPVAFKAYSYCIYTSDNGVTVSNGPVTFDLETVGTLTELPIRSEDGMSSFSGTMIGKLWFVNMHITTADKDNAKADTDDNRGQAAYYLSLVDRETGEAYAMYPSDKVYSAMAYNYSDDKVYAIYKTAAGAELYSIDYRTGEATLVAAAATTAPGLFTLAIDLEGNAYGISSDKNLYSINLEDFSTVVVGSTGVSEVAYVQTMAFDHNTETIYWNISNNSQGALYSVDHVSGAATFIGDHPNEAELVSLGFAYGATEHYAAMKIVDPSGNALNGADVTIDGKTLVTDNYGYAAFIGIELDATVAYSITYNDVTKTGAFSIDESKVVEVVFNENGPEFPDAYAYCLYTADNSVAGPIKYNLGEPNNMTPLPVGTTNDIISYGGVMANGLFIANMLQRVADDKGLVGLEKNRAANPLSIAVIDKVTGEYYTIAETSAYFTDMAYNPIDDKVYGVNNTDAGWQLASVDYRTGVLTELSTIAEGAPDCYTLGINSAGEAYSVATDGNLYAINLEDFTYELVGATGAPIPNYVQCIEFDLNTDKLYWNQLNADGAGVYEINPTTGVATLMQAFNQLTELSGLGFETATEMYYAAIKLHDLSSNPIAGASITIDGRTLITDSRGYATFTDVNLEQYTGSAVIDGVTYPIDITVTESGVYVVQPTGLNEINGQLGVYPNPTTGLVNIAGIENIEYVELVDMNGRIVLHENNNNNEINLSGLNKGVYTLRVFTNQSVANQKIILK